MGRDLGSVANQIISKPLAYTNTLDWRIPCRSTRISPILRAALDAGVDYLVTSDEHLLQLNPYESLRGISMTEYVRIVQNAGHIS